jgi:tripartite-type tricarboxylate transporter receptor subunit TctC
MLLLGPAGLPTEIVSLLNREIASIMQEKDVRAAYETTGADPVYGTLEEVQALIARETELNTSLVRKLGLQPE